MEKKLIEFKNIVKEFDGKLVLKGVSLDIYENEFVTLLGPSGCGKTTTSAYSGRLYLEPDSGKAMCSSTARTSRKVPPYKRELNTVFQKYALFPHMNVYEQHCLRPEDQEEAQGLSSTQKVMRMLKLVNLAGLCRPQCHRDCLSGGQQQRVAIARAHGQRAERSCSWTNPWAPWITSCVRRCSMSSMRIQQEAGHHLHLRDP